VPAVVRAQHIVEGDEVHMCLVGRRPADHRGADLEAPVLPPRPARLQKEAAELLGGRPDEDAITVDQRLGRLDPDVEFPCGLTRRQVESHQAAIGGRNVHARAFDRRPLLDGTRFATPDSRTVGDAKADDLLARRHDQPLAVHQRRRGQPAGAIGPDDRARRRVETAQFTGDGDHETILGRCHRAIHFDRRLPDFGAIIEASGGEAGLQREVQPTRGGHGRRNGQRRHLDPPDGRRGKHLRLFGRARLSICRDRREQERRNDRGGARESHTL